MPPRGYSLFAIQKMEETPQSSKMYVEHVQISLLSMCEKIHQNQNSFRQKKLNVKIRVYRQKSFLEKIVFPPCVSPFRRVFVVFRSRFMMVEGGCSFVFGCGCGCGLLLIVQILPSRLLYVHMLRGRVDVLRLLTAEWRLELLEYGRWPIIIFQCRRTLFHSCP